MLRFLAKYITKPGKRFNERSFTHERSLIYNIRHMEERDQPVLNELLNKEKWIMENAYLQCAFRTDPRGFFVAVRDDGEIIGSATYLAFSDTVYVAGLGLVKAEYRKLNVWKTLMGKIMNDLRGKEVAGYVWPWLQGRWRANGSLSIKDYHRIYVWYHYGRIYTRTCDIIPNKYVSVHPVCKVSYADLIEYDTEIHIFKREKYIKNWINHKMSTTYVAKQHGRICGYGVLRSQDSFNQIGPLYADNSDIAYTLFSYLVKELHSGDMWGFCCPLDNEIAMKFAAINRMIKPGFPMVLDFSIKPLQYDTGRVYALSSASYGIC